MEMNLILFGPPGVGKGTQARLLAQEHHIPHISTGDILRSAVTAGTDLGKQAKAIMDAGKLVPDEIMIRMVYDALASPAASAGFILDGFPRTLEQAKALTEVFSQLHVREYRVIHFNVDDEEIVQRLGNRLVCPKNGKIFNTEADGVSIGSPCPECGTALVQREDDRPDTVRERLRVYHNPTQPVIEYYKERGVVITVDGSESIDMVNREIRMMLT